MGKSNYPQAKLDLSEILEYANSEENYLDKQRILKQQLPLLQSYAKELDLYSVISLLKSFPVNIQEEFWREFDRDLDSEMHENLERNKPTGFINLARQNSKILEIVRPKKRTKRTNQLHDLIMKIALAMKEEHGKKPSSRKLMKKIERDYLEFDEEAIIQEVTEKGIYWISKYGIEQHLKWSSFDATFSRLWRKN